MYQIVISRSALKDLQQIPQVAVKKIVSDIDALSLNPRPAGCKKLKGISEEIWRIRQGDYRIIYSISDNIRIVDIRRVRHRKHVYD